MQTYADVLGHPMQIAGSPQTPALGAAISAAVAAGAVAGGFDTFEEAQARMTSVLPHAFVPDPARHAVYDELYKMYRELHDTFGGRPDASSGCGTLMKRLLALRDRVVAERSARGPELAGA
jgi:L-ribulokinase